MKSVLKFRVAIVAVCSLQLFGSLVAKPPALTNVAETCYMNSLLQNLFNIVPLADEIITMPLTNDLFADGYIKAFQAMNKAYPGEVVGENVLKEIGQQGCKRMSARFGAQQDAHELLAAFWKDNSFDTSFLNLFGYTTATQMTCGPTRYDIEKDPNKKHDMIVKVPSKEKPEHNDKTLEDCLASWSKETGLEARGHMDCTKETFISGLSDYLAINITRFEGYWDYSAEKLVTKKIDDPVIISQTLDLAPYVLPENRLQGAEMLQYNLIGIVAQWGSLDSGHYTAYIKDQRSKDQAWWYCSDKTIQETNWSDVQKAIPKEAYILFYKRDNTQLDQLANALNALAVGA